MSYLCCYTECMERTTQKIERRPDFAAIKSFAEFSRYYWYREELKLICKTLGIDASGMKAELVRRIEAYFAGNKILPQAPCRRPRCAPAHVSTDAHASTDTLSLQTGLIACGFRFSKRFRDFFAAQTGVKNFKFNVNMVASAKKVKEDGDLSFTLGDLLDVYYGKKCYAAYDNASLQWNRFVKDFCADEASAAFPCRMKTAAILWKEVRDSTREKIYTHDLLAEFAEQIWQGGNDGI